MKRYLRILFITPRLPYPLDRGDRIRVYNFAKILAEKHSLSLCSLIQSKDEYKYEKNLQNLFDRIELILLKPWKSHMNMATHFFSKLPLQVAYFNSFEMRKKIEQILKDEKFDLIYSFHLRTAHYVNKLNLMNAYTVLDLTDSVSLFLHRILLHSKIYLKPIYYREWLATRRYEASIVKQFNECWLISNIDKRAIERLAPNSHLFIIPNGIDIEYFSPYKRSNQKRVLENLLFVGYLGVQNVDAVLYFYRKIFPLIRSEFPLVKFYVVGANPPRQICRLDDKSVIVTGYVEDLWSYYRKASVMVAPMRFVVGIQNKILEAMAMEVPVVTTNFGNEGIDARHEKEIFVADDPAEFANYVIKLLKNKELREEIGKNARKFVKKKFTWQEVAHRVDKILETIIL